MEQKSIPKAEVNLLHLFLIAASWLVILEVTPLLNRLFHFRQSSLLSLLAALRMSFMLLVTYLYVRLREKQGFASGFHFKLEKIGRSALWAFLFFLLTVAFLMPYQHFIVQPV